GLDKPHQIGAIRALAVVDQPALEYRNADGVSQVRLRRSACAELLIVQLVQLRNGPLLLLRSELDTLRSPGREPGLDHTHACIRLARNVDEIEPQARTPRLVDVVEVAVTDQRRALAIR